MSSEPSSPIIIPPPTLNKLRAKRAHRPISGSIGSNSSRRGLVALDGAASSTTTTTVTTTTVTTIASGARRRDSKRHSVVGMDGRHHLAAPSSSEPVSSIVPIVPKRSSVASELAAAVRRKERRKATLDGVSSGVVRIQVDMAGSGDTDRGLDGRMEQLSIIDRQYMDGMEGQDGESVHVVDAGDGDATPSPTLWQRHGHVGQSYSVKALDKQRQQHSHQIHQDVVDGPGYSYAFKPASTSPPTTAPLDLSRRKLRGQASVQSMGSTFSTPDTPGLTGSTYSDSTADVESPRSSMGSSWPSHAQRSNLRSLEPASPTVAEGIVPDHHHHLLEPTSPNRPTSQLRNEVDTTDGVNDESIVDPEAALAETCPIDREPEPDLHTMMFGDGAETSSEEDDDDDASLNNAALEAFPIPVSMPNSPNPATPIRTGMYVEPKSPSMHSGIHVNSMRTVVSRSNRQPSGKSAIPTDKHVAPWDLEEELEIQDRVFRAEMKKVSKADKERRKYLRTQFDQHRMPQQKDVYEASLLSVKDEYGNKIRFGSLFEGQRTIVLFIRHFWCSQCQDYVDDIAKVKPEILAKHKLRLIIVSNGSWKMIKPYKKLLGDKCPYPIYTDRGKHVYTALGLVLRSFNANKGEEVGKYIKHSLGASVVVGIVNGAKLPIKPPGDQLQLGGEFILGPRHNVKFAHRMKGTRDHAEIEEVLSSVGVNLDEELASLVPPSVAAAPRTSSSSRKVSTPTPSAVPCFTLSQAPSPRLGNGLLSKSHGSLSRSSGSLSKRDKRQSLGISSESAQKGLFIHTADDDGDVEIMRTSTGGIGSVRKPAQTRSRSGLADGPPTIPTPVPQSIFRVSINGSEDGSQMTHRPSSDTVAHSASHVNTPGSPTSVFASTSSQIASPVSMDMSRFSSSSSDGTPKLMQRLTNSFRTHVRPQSGLHPPKSYLTANGSSASIRSNNSGRLVQRLSVLPQ